MAAFEYQALDAGGRTVKGVQEGDAERQVRALLREKGLTPLQVQVIQETDDGGAARGLRIRRGISTGDLALITRQFSTLVHAGLTVEECLNALIEQTESTRARAVLAAVRGRVMEGQSLARSLAAFPNAFPDIFRYMIDAGEESGRLGEVLDRLADYIENRHALQQKVFQAFIYPAVVVIFSLAIVTLLVAYVVPQVAGVFTSMGQTLPFLTRALIAISDVIRAGGLWWVVLFVGVFFGVRWLLQRPAVRLRWHRLLLRMPVTSRLTRGLNAERMASTLAILTGSGIPLLDAMHSAVQVVGNLPMRASVEDALRQVREGGSLSRALGKARLFPPLVIHLIASGEATGKLDAMLHRASQAQSRELEGWVKAFTAILEPLLIIFMGVVVLLIVLAILLPIFEMNKLIQ